MKKLAIALMLGAAAVTASAQVNYTVQTACHPLDVKHYDTQRLRSSFMMSKVMAPDEINVTYTLYDRLIYGGAMPVNKVLKLETFRELGPEITYFLERRELGVINTGGDGVVTVDGKEYPMKYKEALYVGCGNKEVTFKSNDAANPAKFYINCGGCCSCCDMSYQEGIGCQTISCQAATGIETEPSQPEEIGRAHV